MKSKTKSFQLFIFFVSVGLLFLQNYPQAQINIDDYSADAIISWNKKIFEIAVAEDKLLTLKGVRTAAMMHIAIYDALNTIETKYTRYSYNGEKINADPVAAAMYAAYEVTVKQYPDKQEELELELRRWLDQIDNEKGIVAGEKLGKSSASSILDKRLNDNWNDEADYMWHPMAPGVYAEFNEHSGTPEGFIFGAGWAEAEPFMLPSQEYFKSPPPPEIESEEYNNAFNEVKEVGKCESKTRTPDQTHLAMWWKDFVENSHNRLARHLIEKEELNLWDAARTFALLNMVIFDAYVSVFYNKFYYNHWRPYTAIRWAANDGNPDTEPDTTWNNLHNHTYAFPSYPSAHGCASTAAMTVLANTLGVGDEYNFRMTTEEVDSAGPFSGKIKMDPPTRLFYSFSEAGMEAAMSRVYLGIHFRYDSEEGYNLGKQIGEYANQHFLTPVNK